MRRYAVNAALAVLSALVVSFVVLPLAEKMLSREFLYLTAWIVLVVATVAGIALLTLTGRRGRSEQ